MCKNLTLQLNGSIELSVESKNNSVTKSTKETARTSGSNIVKFIKNAASKGKSITVLPRVFRESCYPYFYIKVWTKEGFVEGILNANTQTEQFITALVKGEEELPQVVDIDERKVVEASEWINEMQSLTASNAVKITKQMDMLDDGTVYTYYVHKCKLCKVQYPSTKSTIDELF